MSALTKKLHTEEKVYYICCPAGVDIDKETQALCDLGCKISNAISPEDIFTDIGPASYLSGARYKEGLTQEELSLKTNISRRHISEMENGKRSIGKNNAKKLAAALNTNYRLFL